MKIAILHYHLRPGGVATVVKQQAAALSKGDEVLLVAGEVPLADPGYPVAVVPGLAYDALRPVQSPERTASDLESAVRSHFGGPCDVLHVHNPTLRKNSAFLRVLSVLRERGTVLYSQIHDLAEDGRPQSYFAEGDYPADSRYAAINSRDFRILSDCGLGDEGLDLLFNVVTPIGALDPRAEKNTVVYPVRAIRRKNIGEALFLSLFLPKGVSLAITLPPTSPRDLPSYEAWKAAAARLRLPVEFEAGLDRDFNAVMSSARAVLTTSLKEGFGFSFLEPWTAGIPVAGRRLEAVCPDFEKEGIEQPRLYGELRVPISLIDLASFRAVWLSAVRDRDAGFGRRSDEAALAAGFERLVSGGAVDFGALDRQRQEALCEAARSDAAVRSAVLDANPSLPTLFDRPPEDLVERNRAAVRERYTLDRYRAALLAGYRAALGPQARRAIDKSALLDRFLKPEDFRFAATEEVAR